MISRHGQNPPKIKSEKARSNNPSGSYVACIVCRMQFIYSMAFGELLESCLALLQSSIGNTSNVMVCIYSS